MISIKYQTCESLHGSNLPSSVEWAVSDVPYQAYCYVRASRMHLPQRCELRISAHFVVPILQVFRGLVESGTVTASDGRRALVTLPNDPDLVNILAKNGVDITVSEGEQQSSFVSLLGNLLFPLLAFGGLFFLFRC